MLFSFSGSRTVTLAHSRNPSHPIRPGVDIRNSLGIIAPISKGAAALGLKQRSVSKIAQERFGFSPQDLRTLRGLKTPARIQKFIDELTYQYANTAWSPRRVLRERKGHCLEGRSWPLLRCASRDIHRY